MCCRYVIFQPLPLQPGPARGFCLLEAVSTAPVARCGVCTGSRVDPSGKVGPHLSTHACDPVGRDVSTKDVSPQLWILLVLQVGNSAP